MKKHVHIPLEGVQGHITWTGNEPPSEETLFALNDMAQRAFKMFEVTPRQLKQRTCKHDWKKTYSGYCADCKRCGKKI